jgi:alanine racemase
VQRAEAVVDLGAIRGNVERLKAATSAELLAVVKADGYGHGLVPSAEAALSGGASWLGTATLDEALALRAAEITAPVLTWLWTPADAERVHAAIDAGIDVSVSSTWQLATVLDAVTAGGGHPRRARVHLKVDTGLSRNGSTRDDWPELLAAVGRGASSLDVVGIWSHFAYADEPGHPTIARQLDAFADALDVAKRVGIEPQLRHIANSAATLTLPEAHFDLVRPGVAIYGLSPVPPEGDFGLLPAMTLRSGLASVKRVRAGEGVSYGHTYTTGHDTTLALVPLGYADGIPRAASNVGPVSIGGTRYTISGRVCMDQFVVDVGPEPSLEVESTAVLFGTGRDGEPTAQDWADAVGTIHYEIVTRIGPRVPRTYVDSSHDIS